MSKIRVVQHSKYIGYSGTDRTAQLFAKYLNQDDKYDCYLVYRQGYCDERLEIMEGILGKDHVIPYEWVPGKKGRQPPYLPEHDNLYEVLQKIDPDIVHVHRAGIQEWPMKYLAPKAKWVETNIFGFADKTKDIDKHIYISDFIRNSALKYGNSDGPVLYNPIEKPVDRKELPPISFKRELGFGDETVLLGRIGRPDNFDPIALRAFARLEQENLNVHYLVVNACHNWIDTARQLGIKNITFLPAIIDDVLLSRFYQSLDIYAHARSDGECCPCNIQEAMMHGLPVVSHRSATYNGQSEIIGDSGFVVPIGDSEAYYQVLKRLVEDSGLRIMFGGMAALRAQMNFDAARIVDQLKGIYETL
jgi:glycosyltransferase involved in cell wall biosynthesis